MSQEKFDDSIPEKEAEEVESEVVLSNDVESREGIEGDIDEVVGDHFDEVVFLLGEEIQKGLDENTEKRKKEGEQGMQEQIENGIPTEEDLKAVREKTENEIKSKPELRKKLKAMVLSLGLLGMAVPVTVDADTIEEIRREFTEQVRRNESDELNDMYRKGKKDGLDGYYGGYRYKGDRSEAYEMGFYLGTQKRHKDVLRGRDPKKRAGRRVERLREHVGGEIIRGILGNIFSR